MNHKQLRRKSIWSFLSIDSCKVSTKSNERETTDPRTVELSERMVVSSGKGKKKLGVRKKNGRP